MCHQVVILFCSLCAIACSIPVSMKKENSSPAEVLWNQDQTKASSPRLIKLLLQNTVNDAEKDLSWLPNFHHGTQTFVRQKRQVDSTNQQVLDFFNTSKTSTGTGSHQLRWGRSIDKKQHKSHKGVSANQNKKRELTMDKLDSASLAALAQFLRDKLLNGTGGIQLRYGRSLK